MSNFESADQERSGYDSARADVRKLYDTLQGGLSVETSATSINGRTFEFVTALDVPVPLGGFVVIETSDARKYLGQVTDRSTDWQAGERVMVDLPEFGFGDARVSQAEIQLEQRTVVGGGTLLARITDEDLLSTYHYDVFDSADMTQASLEVVEQFMESVGRGKAGLDIGWSPFGSPDVRTTLHSGGFNRDTFLMGR